MEKYIIAKNNFNRGFNLQIFIYLEILFKSVSKINKSRIL